MRIKPLHIVYIVSLILVITFIAFSIPKNSNKAGLNQIYVQVNGQFIEPENNPLRVNDDLLIPASVFEMFGATVNWSEELNRVVISDSITVELTVDSSIAVIDGQEYKMDVTISMIDGQIMVPVHFLCEQFGIRVDFNKDNNILVMENRSELLMHFGRALEFFDIDVIAEVTDVDTGITYMVKRIGGDTFADVETLTAEDTDLLKYTYDGEWSWRRRAVIVKIGDIEIAGSMAAMPHSGRDDAPFGVIVDNRSGGAGRGI